MRCPGRPVALLDHAEEVAAVQPPGGLRRGEVRARLRVGTADVDRPADRARRRVGGDEGLVAGRDDEAVAADRDVAVRCELRGVDGPHSTGVGGVDDRDRTSHRADVDETVGPECDRPCVHALLCTLGPRRPCETAELGAVGGAVEDEISVVPSDNRDQRSVSVDRDVAGTDGKCDRAEDPPARRHLVDRERCTVTTIRLLQVGELETAVSPGQAAVVRRIGRRH